ncbi:MAG: hypothetical protein DI598_02725 [Pseudopedobacter saltans]|uniref:HNH endonuclease 5 domain-containing protein n=1 Tax=Pseudopedobacter saltans TaxID=151895 RepID=A0A2W5H0M6_9SPHI|nr:MAG: hypothetical protein DI598_02725 [Pseudopedobacter saltans]
MNLPKCKLCLNNFADKENSHIIPKFLCKGLFENINPRYALSINKFGKGRKIQDTPKENNILCSNCEHRIEIIETIFSKFFREIHSYKSLNEKFKIFQKGAQEYIECKNINPTLFKLFIYSLVWRSSISNLFEFQSFKLNKNNEDEIRTILNSNLKSNKAELFENLNRIQDFTPYHNCIIKPKEKSASTRGIFSVSSMSNDSHILLLVDIAILFYTDNYSIGSVLEKYSNKQNEIVIITLGEKDAWFDLNKALISKMLKQN